MEDERFSEEEGENPGGEMYEPHKQFQRGMDGSTKSIVMVW
jgi:hypothetical protein